MRQGVSCRRMRLIAGCMGTFLVVSSCASQFETIDWMLMPPLPFCDSGEHRWDADDPWKETSCGLVIIAVPSKVRR